MHGFLTPICVDCAPCISRLTEKDTLNATAYYLKTRKRVHFHLSASLGESGKVEYIAQVTVGSKVKVHSIESKSEGLSLLVNLYKFKRKNLQTYYKSHQLFEAGQLLQRIQYTEKYF